MAQFAGHVVEVDHHRGHQRGNQEAIADPGAQGPQDDQGGEEVRDLVERPAREEGVSGQAIDPVGEDESHHGRRKRTR